MRMVPPEIVMQQSALPPKLSCPLPPKPLWSAPPAALSPSSLETMSIVTPGLTYCGDEYAIRQLVSILLDNAVKYAAPDTPIVFSLEKGRRGVVIRTENRCDALDTAALGRLFDRFYRADPARSAETSGFGIGLSIARSIAEGHRGTIRAESPDGRTIVFTAELK